MIRSSALRHLLPFVLGTVVLSCGTPLRVEPTESTKAPVRAPRAVVPDELDTRPVESPPPPPPPRPTPRAATPATSLTGKVVVVDAGHGGVDPGARSSGAPAVVEKDVVLDVARRVAAGLKERGARVHLTRDGDVKIALDARAATADRVSADLLVSIHADAAENTAAHGFGVWIARQARRESVAAAEALLAEARRAGLPVRSVHRADFRVLVGHRRPSVLVELGFLSNPGDARLLSTSGHRTRVAAAIVAGVERALR